MRLAAKHALRQAGHDLPAALVMLKTGVNLRRARQSSRKPVETCAKPDMREATFAHIAISKLRAERRSSCALLARKGRNEGSTMDRFKIQGGRKLEGTVRISGAKNAALPAMAAALLTADTVT